MLMTYLRKDPISALCHFSILIFSFFILVSWSGIDLKKQGHNTPFPQYQDDGISLLDLGENQVSVRVTGTNQTTGHIADIHLRNLTEDDILINVPPVFIPATEGYQPYISPLPGSILLPGGSQGTSNPEVVFPLNGYCVDVNKPPVPEGNPIIPIDNWIEPNMNNFDEDGYNPGVDPRVINDPEPYFPGFTDDDNGPLGEGLGEPLDGITISPLSEGEGIERVVKDKLIEENPPSVLLPTNPIQRDFQDEIFDNPLIANPGDLEFDVPVFEVDPHKQPELFTDLLYDAITKITNTVDQFIDDGNLINPMTERDDFRESTIQQTFWIYTSNLVGNPYVFIDFRDVLIDQFSEATGMDLEDAQENIKEEVESGAVSIWDSFKLVGEKAKVFKEFNPPRDKVEEVFEPAKGDGKFVAEDADQQKSGVPHTHSEPVNPPCACGDFSISPGKIVNKATGEEITEDSISTLLVEEVVYQPPQIELDCPDYCRYDEYFINKVITGYYHGYGGGTSFSSRSVESPVKGRSYKDFESQVAAYCERELCVDEIVERRIYFTEDNDCCDEIRAQNYGRLSLSLGQKGNVEISGNTMSFNLTNPNRRITHESEFNIEALFCNLSGDQVFAQFLSEHIQHTRGPEVSEGSKISDISMGHNSGTGGQRPHYTLRLQKSVNGDEFSFMMSMDEESCNFDLQVVSDGQIIEQLGQPNTSISDLNDWISGIKPWDSDFFSHATAQYFELIKHQYHNSEGADLALFLNYLETAVIYRLEDNPDPETRRNLENVLDGIKRVRESGDILDIGLVFGAISTM
jgi:hypothetical protein